MHFVSPRIGIVQDGFGAVLFVAGESHPTQIANRDRCHHPILIDANKLSQLIARFDLGTDVDGPVENLGVEGSQDLGSIQIEDRAFDSRFGGV